jgi:DNA-binding response OmpR family regulator
LAFDDIIEPRMAFRGVRESMDMERPVRVLIVEDCADTAQSMSMLLDRVGYATAIAATGAGALLAVSQRVPDIILLDIGLPDLNGWDLAEKLRDIKVLKETMIVALSGHGRADDVERSLRAGCAMHLLKPVDFDVLLSRLREGLESFRESARTTQRA